MSVPASLLGVCLRAGGAARLSLAGVPAVAAADGLPRNAAHVGQSSISRKCPGEPGRCLFSNPEPGDDTRVMPFWVN